MGWMADQLGVGEYADQIEAASRRQFDDQPGGGAFDPDTYLPGVEAEGSDADVSDPAPLEGTFASIPRQFDDQEGGGFADVWGNAAESAAEDAANAAGEAADAAGEAAQQGLPDWVLWVGDHPFEVGAAIILSYLFVSAGGITETAEVAT